MQKIFTVLVLLTFGSDAYAETKCNLNFDVMTGAAHGIIPSGDTLKGSASFESVGEVRLDVETLSYYAEGTMRIEAADGSAVSGSIGVVHVVRTPYTADYISIDVTEVSGNLGGIPDYADPMLVTLYAKPNTLIMQNPIHLPRPTYPKRPGIGTNWVKGRCFRSIHPTRTQPCRAWLKT